MQDKTSMNIPVNAKQVCANIRYKYIQISKKYIILSCYFVLPRK